MCLNYVEEHVNPKPFVVDLSFSLLRGRLTWERGFDEVDALWDTLIRERCGTI